MRMLVRTSSILLALSFLLTGCDSPSRMPTDGRFAVTMEHNGTVTASRRRIYRVYDRKTGKEYIGMLDVDLTEVSK